MIVYAASSEDTTLYLSSNDKLQDFCPNVLSHKESERNTSEPIIIGPDTVVTILYPKYRVTLCLDISPSMVTAATMCGSLPIDQLFPTLKQCLTSLVEPTVLDKTPLMVPFSKLGKILTSF
jgi:hypothetical protein